MEITTLPVQLSPQTPPGLPGDADAAAPAGLPQDLFAALLAGQMGAVGDAVLTVADASGGSAEDADPRLGQEGTGLPVDAALPALLAGLAVVQPAQDAQDAQADVGVELAVAGPASQVSLAGARQPVAAAAAAFAGGVAEAGGGSDGAPFVVPDLAPAAAAPAAPSLVPAPQPSPAASVVPAAQAASPAGTIPQPVSSPAWGEALGERVMWMVGQQHQGAELRLNPPALGPLEIRLSMSDGQASLTFSTQHLPVREALEAATPRLREMFNESGISLGSVSVNVGSFSQQQPSEQPMAGGSGSGWAASGAADGAGGAPLPAAVTLLKSGRGMVDIFA